MLKNLIAKANSITCSIIVGSLSFAVSNPALAVSFDFTQVGYGDNGRVLGFFTGEDFNISGSITKEELKDFSATYLSDTVFPFTRNLGQLDSFIYSPNEFNFSTSFGDDAHAIWLRSGNMNYITRSDRFTGGFCGSRCIIAATIAEPSVFQSFIPNLPIPTSPMLIKPSVKVSESGTLLGLTLFGLSFLFGEKLKSHKFSN